MLDTEGNELNTIRNIYCVGRNYASFAEQMGNAMPERPLIFMKPTHSLKRMNGSSAEYQGRKGEVNCEAELVLYIGKAFEKGVKVSEIIEKITIGIDFTYRDVLNNVKKKGQPWLLAKGFPNASTIGEFRTFSTESIDQNNFELLINGETQQVGNIRNMIFSLQTVVDYIGENFGLGPGDLIFTGTPEGIGILQDGDVLEVKWGKESLGTCEVVLK